MIDEKMIEEAISGYADKRYGEDDEVSLNQILGAFDNAMCSLLDTLKYGVGNLQRIMLGLPSV